jgi:hypothetical protein
MASANCGVIDEGKGRSELATRLQGKNEIEEVNVCEMFCFASPVPFLSEQLHFCFCLLLTALKLFDDGFSFGRPPQIAKLCAMLTLCFHGWTVVGIL